MKQTFTDVLGKAAFDARRQALVSGVYPKSAFNTPSQDKYYSWDGRDESSSITIEEGIKALYRQDGQAAVEAFLLFVTMHGSPEARQAMRTVLREMKDAIFTDIEQAQMDITQGESKRNA